MAEIVEFRELDWACYTPYTDSGAKVAWNCSGRYVRESDYAALQAEIDAVMHFVDKWLNGDELKESPANRANAAREKALKAIDALLERHRRLIAALEKCPDIRADLDSPISIWFEAINAALAEEVDYVQRS